MKKIKLDSLCTQIVNPKAQCCWKQRAANRALKTRREGRPLPCLTSGVALRAAVTTSRGHSWGSDSCAQAAYGGSFSSSFLTNWALALLCQKHLPW